MCRKCGEKITEMDITRSSVCGTCGADLHSCVNCRFYSPGSHYDCRETVDEPVRDKERANFCGYFSVFTGEFVQNAASEKKSAARADFAALFGGSAL